LNQGTSLHLLSKSDKQNTEGSGKPMKKLPLIIECELFVRSLGQDQLKTRTRILGGRHGDFILIEDPIFHINERLTALPEKEFVCSFFHDGDIYRFQTRIQQVMGRGLSLIDYPDQFQVENVRKHHRIQVNIETHFVAQGSRETVSGTIRDVSEGGCYLLVPALMSAFQNMLCKVSFVLPDGQQIAGVDAKVRTVRMIKLKRVTELGLEFLGPREHLAKIASFCRFCLFFKV